MMALNAETGKIIWQSKYRAPYVIGNPTKPESDAYGLTPSTSSAFELSRATVVVHKRWPIFH
jgi:hypothetical protein